MIHLLLAVALCLLSTTAPSEASSRIKDITSVQGLRDNQLVGYGLVVGLSGTGDSMRNSPFTEQAMQSMLDRLGVSTRGAQSRPKNVAAVIVTANMAPSIQLGTRFDVTVSSLGDATSLLGGTLVLTPLLGPDGATYAVAQGQISVSGFAAQGRSEVVTQGVPTTARIPNGAVIERTLPISLNDSRTITLTLHNPDFSTVVSIVNAINAYAKRTFGHAIAEEVDNRSLSIRRPARRSHVRLLSDIGDLLVDADTPARVVIDPRSGTIVIGRDVRLSAAAVTHGTLTVRVTETPQVSQPQPFSSGSTTITSQTAVSAEEERGQFQIVEGPTLRGLIRGLNQTGVKPNGIIAVLQALRTAGALQAEIVIQP